MKCIILCSPSPGVIESEKIIFTSFNIVDYLDAIYIFKAEVKRRINGVPGVI